jgi:exosortase A-associated hydrolase 2
MATVLESSVEFESGGHTLRGIIHRPAETPPAAGMVFVHPFAEEKKCSHRTLVETARRAAAIGCASLRFDLRGCGDSDGRFGEATLDGWRADLWAAIATAKRALDCDRLGLLGLRLGATLAAEAAEEDVTLGFLVLWEPIVDGRRYLSLTMRRSMMRKKLTAHEGGNGAGAPADEEPDETDAVIDLDGYLVPPGTQEEMVEIDLLSAAKAFPGPTLVLNLSARPKVAAPLEQLASLYVSGEAIAVRQEPVWSMVGLVDPTPTIDVTLEWLARAAGIS